MFLNVCFFDLKIKFISLQSIKQRAKSQYYSNMILHYKDNIKKLASYEGSDWQRQTCQ